MADEHRELFISDQNYGLVKQCLNKHTRTRIARLTETYVRLSFEEIASKADASGVDIEKILLDMVWP